MSALPKRPRDVRQADVGMRRSDVAVLPAADRSDPAEIDAMKAAGRRRRSAPEAGEDGPGAAHRDGFHGAGRGRRSGQGVRAGPRTSRAAIGFEGSLRWTSRGNPPVGWRESSWMRGSPASTSEAARKIQQGGVRLNGERISDPRHRLGGGHSAGDAAGRPADAATPEALSAGWEGCDRRSTTSLLCDCSPHAGCVRRRDPEPR